MLFQKIIQITGMEVTVHLKGVKNSQQNKIRVKVKLKVKVNIKIEVKVKLLSSRRRSKMVEE